MSCVKCILCPEAQSQMQKCFKKKKKKKNARSSKEAEAEGPVFTETSCAMEAGTAAAPAVSPRAGGSLPALM